VLLELLDELPEGALLLDSTVELFFPSEEGVHRWLTLVSMEPADQVASVELIGSPLFIQRRLEHRFETDLPGEIRRVKSMRRGRPADVKVVNLSRGGMKLAGGGAHLATGDTVEVTVALGTDRVVVAGRVVMTYSGGDTFAAHVSFFDDQRESVRTIERYLAGAWK
jgi:hypothetical protein